MKKTLLTFSLLFLCIAVSTFFFSKTIEAQSAVTLSLSPASQSVTVNDTFSLNIVLNTSGELVSAVDSDMSFDNTRLNLIDIIPSSTFNQYVGESINNSTGRATISGLITDSTNAVTGNVTVATLQFRAIDSGTATVTFDFTPGNTIDANVAVLGTEGDALDSVTNGSYTITSSGSTTNTTTTTNSNSGSTSTSGSGNSDTMPVSGNSLPAIIIAIVGGFFVWLGSFFGKQA